LLWGIIGELGIVVVGGGVVGGRHSSCGTLEVEVSREDDG